MNVLVIPEDFRNDQYILAPIVKALMAAVGRPTANVVICRDPLLGGVREALKWDNLSAIMNRYKSMIDLFILCVDRDGDPHRRLVLDSLEKKVVAVHSIQPALLAENAWQEIEVWVLAGLQDLPSQWEWQDIRQEVDCKERYFEPLAAERGVVHGPGKGRKALAEVAARRYERIRQLCPEDVANLERKVREWMERR